MKLRALALLAVLAPSVSAQIWPDTSIWGNPILPFVDQGRPALLVCGSGNLVKFHNVPWLAGKPLVGRMPGFTMTHAWFQDTRPCAVGNHVWLAIGDDYTVADFGPLKGDGTLLWQGAVELKRPAFYFGGMPPFILSYCSSHGACTNACNPGYYDQPGLSFVVLVPML